MDLIHGNALAILKDFAKESIDMVITSPPYDKLRNYKDIDEFEFSFIADELVRILKPGGVIVWIVGDSTVNGTETGTSFKQALYFKSKGLNLHDTMIFAKNNPMPQIYRSRYTNEFEYMFVLTKGTPVTHNPIMIPTKFPGATPYNKNYSKKEQKRNSHTTTVKKEKIKGNIWYYTVGAKKIDKTAKFHPAAFPYELAKDHVLSWSKEGDVVLDPMMGSGTVGMVCQDHERDFVGIEIVKEYYDQAKERIGGIY
jgi:site-specific DNA-methyltransferase (adenine-specific)|tara:strand:- start:519 stop:1280 length:762 start_codon:yes stop_codon:yes gene_type:complete